MYYENKAGSFIFIDKIHRKEAIKEDESTTEHNSSIRVHIDITYKL
jgi:hypothetical protein